MFLPIQFWFTVQHFLHSNTLGRTVNYIFLFIFYLYSWMKWRNYWFILQSLFPPCSKSATFFVIGELHVEYIPVIWGWRCELFAWKHVAWYAPHGEYVLLTDVYPHIPSKASECAFHQNQRIDVRHFTAKVLDFFSFCLWTQIIIFDAVISRISEKNCIRCSLAVCELQTLYRNQLTWVTRCGFFFLRGYEWLLTGIFLLWIQTSELFFYKYHGTHNSYLSLVFLPGNLIAVHREQMGRSNFI